MQATFTLVQTLLAAFCLTSSLLSAKPTPPLPVADGQTVQLLEPSGCAEPVVVYNNCPDLTPEQIALNVVGLPLQPVAIGDTFTLRLRANHFEQVTAYGLGLQWNANRLALDTFRVWNAPPTDYQLTAAEGLLTLTRAQGEPLSLGAEDDWIELTFRYHQPGYGLFTTLQLTTQQWTHLSGYQYPTHELTVEIPLGVDPAQVRVRAGFEDMDWHGGSTLVAPMFIETTVGLVGVGLTISYDPSLLHFDTLLPHPALAGLEYHHFPHAARISVLATSEDLSAFDLADYDTLLYAHFTPLRPGEGVLQIINTPTIPEFIEEGLSGGVVPTHLQGGVLRVLPDLDIYPGDADANGLVNHFDLLYLGQAQGVAGPVRTEAVTGWAPQPALSWPVATAGSGINLAHADANGDGVVDESDQAIFHTYFQQHHASWNGDLYDRPTPPPAQVASLPGLFVSTDTIHPDQELVVFPLVLGESDAPATDAYGLAVSIHYPPGAIQPGSLRVHTSPGWLGGVEGEQILDFVYHDEAAGRIDLAITRHDGQPVIGAGPLAWLEWAPAPELFTAPAPEPMAFTLTDVLYLNHQEAQLPVAPQTTVAPVWSNTVVHTETPLADIRWKVYPNPATDQVVVDLVGAQVRQWEWLSVQGLQLGVVSGRQRNLLTPTQTGVYFLRAHTTEGVFTHRIVVIR